jgi:hypothetical protein
MPRQGSIWSCESGTWIDLNEIVFVDVIPSDGPDNCDVATIMFRGGANAEAVLTAAEF